MRRSVRMPRLRQSVAKKARCYLIKLFYTLRSGRFTVCFTLSNALRQWRISQS